jgi:hypothetical protein
MAVLFAVAGSKDFVEKHILNFGYEDGYNSPVNTNSPYASLDLRLFCKSGEVRRGLSPWRKPCLESQSTRKKFLPPTGKNSLPIVY